MIAYRLPDGRVLVPMRAVDEESGVTGDGMVVVEADSVEAKEWERWTRPAPPEVASAYSATGSLHSEQRARSSAPRTRRMAIPTYDQFIEPLLHFLASQNGPVPAAAAYAALADAAGLTMEERAAMLPSGRQRVYHNRIGWAHDRLKRKGLLTSPKRGEWLLTEAGRRLATSHPHLSAEQIEDIANWKAPGKISPRTEFGPEERIEQALEEIHDSVAADLLERIRQATPEFFELLVLELLHAMGYGESRRALQHLGGPGDEGVDGVIALDRLGLDRVFVQAKRWKAPVGSPQVQTFLGAMRLKGTEKGVLMTPGEVTKDARQLAEKTNGNLVLIDGTRLAEFMIEHGVGVSERKIAVPHVDQDFFTEE